MQENQQQKQLLALVVDDDPSQRLLQEEILVQAGLSVKQAKDGAEALELFSSFDFDIVLMDIKMPVMDGLEACSKMRKLPQGKNIPIVLITGLDDFDSIQQAFEADATDFITKPVNWPILDHRLRYLLKASKAFDSLRESETRLRETEERLSFAVEGAGDGIWDWDILSNDMQFSRLYMEMLGYDENELPHTVDTWINSVHPDDLERAQQNLQDYLENKIAKYSIQLRLRCKDGSYKWVLCRATLVNHDDDGKPVRMIGIHSDITSQKETEITLVKSESRYRQISNVASDWVWEADENQRFNYISEGMSKISPQAASFVLGKTRQQLINNVKELAKPEWKKHLSDIENKREFRDFQYKFISPEGNKLIFQISGAPIFNEKGEYLGYRGTGSNVTDKIKAQQALKQAKDEAEHANKAKSQFLSNMSHELRTPLNAIMGFSQLLEIEDAPPLTQTQSGYVDEIIKAGDYLLKLIDEILNLAKIEAGRIDLTIEAVEYGLVIGESLQLITPLAEKRGIEIYLRMDGSDISLEQLILQSAVISVDHTRLQQILLNLLSNAIKYNSDNGKLFIDCENIENNQTRISITDTGAGLTQNEQSKLFQAFSRLSFEHSNIEGTGIGLVITRKIVELMNGRLDVKSSPGKGSTFSIEFPNDCQHHAEKDMLDKNQTVLPASSPATHENQYKLLYIEDNPANLRLVTELLNQRPYIQLISAQEPSLGLELAIQHIPDLILLDINLPGMDGYELLKQLRRHEDTRGISVVAISANAMSDDIERGLKAGFDNYITKPIDVNALLQNIDIALSNYSRSIVET